MFDLKSLEPKPIDPDDFGVTGSDNPAYEWFRKCLAEGVPMELPALDVTVPEGSPEGTKSTYEQVQILVSNAATKFERDHANVRPDEIVKADVKRNKKTGVIRMRALWIERPAKPAEEAPAEAEAEAVPTETGSPEQSSTAEVEAPAPAPAPAPTRRRARTA